MKEIKKPKKYKKSAVPPLRYTFFVAKMYKLIFIQYINRLLSLNNVLLAPLEEGSLSLNNKRSYLKSGRCCKQRPLEGSVQKSKIK